MQKDTLYLACTRTAKSYMGVPANGLLVNAMGCYLGYIVIGGADILHFRGYAWPFAFVLIHFAMVLLVERDPNIFRIIRLVIDTYTINPVLWAASSRLPRKARMMNSAI